MPLVALSRLFRELLFELADLLGLMRDESLILLDLVRQTLNQFLSVRHASLAKKVPCHGRADTRQGTPRQATIFLSSPTTSPESTRYANGLRGAPLGIVGGALGCVISCVV